MKLTAGMEASDFALPDQNNIMHLLAGEKGNWVLLYFYPKDDTSGCTTEACGIRDNFQDFKKLNITVFGVSADSVESHKKFAEKFGLPFPLLADEDKKVIEAYDVWGLKKMMGKEFMGIRRTSFLIDPKGLIKKIYEGVKPEGHATEVLADIRTFTGT